MREKEFLPLVREKLNIEELNPMQVKMMAAAAEPRDLILLSPTGSGKTLAFMLPVLKMLKAPTGRVQAVVIAPSRELVMQIAQVARSIAAGYKVTALYGGHKVEDETNSLSVVPDIVVATPGRLLDHARRRNIDLLPVRMLVLDEFDKSLELGFEEDMEKLIGRMKNVSRIILTSATRAETLPDFLKLTQPLTMDYLGESKELRRRQRVHRVDSSGKDKLETLAALLRDITDGPAPERTIVFVNHRESAERVAEYLRKHGMDAVLYHGALEQRERETAVSQFNNGSRPILVATDLAARGLDIEKVTSIIHYHQALTPETHTHRNGRTARVDAEGDIYVMIGPDEDVKPFVEFDDTRHIDTSAQAEIRSGLSTLYISAGKKEKLSKGDIVGFLTKQCGVPGDEVGRIDLFDHYSLVALPRKAALEAEQQARTAKIKGEKRKVTMLK